MKRRRLGQEGLNFRSIFFSALVDLLKVFMSMAYRDRFERGMETCEIAIGGSS